MTAPTSFLFVPGDSARKMAKAQAGAAQALMLDLEDSVAAEKLDEARQTVRQFLQDHPDRSKQQLWVRINPIDSDKSLGDLAVVVAGKPDGVLLPKTRSGADVTLLDHFLTALERREGVEQGSIKIMAVATETADAMFSLGTYKDCSPRLFGLTWGAEDLATALGASTNKGEDSAYALPYQLARTLCLMGAKSAGVAAVDTINPNFKDPEVVRNEVRRAKMDGFNAKFAIHPDQIEAINGGFKPDENEVRKARAIVAAFRDNPGAGTLQVEGLMVDKPHLTQSLRILEAAGIRPESA